MPYLFLLFVAIPIIEIAVLIQVGSAIGLFMTIAIVILTAILGTAMLRQQGMATMMNARNRMQSGEMPAMEMMEGVFLLIGGVLLLTPGFVTDAFGFACLIPWSRRFLASRLGRLANVSVMGMPDKPHGRPRSEAETTGSHDTPRQRQAPRPRSGAEDSNVLEGEYRRED